MAASCAGLPAGNPSSLLIGQIKNIRFTYQ
jgi:hypothetical protein